MAQPQPDRGSSSRSACDDTEACGLKGRVFRFGCAAAQRAAVLCFAGETPGGTGGTPALLRQGTSRAVELGGGSVGPGVLDEEESAGAVEQFKKRPGGPMNQIGGDRGHPDPAERRPAAVW